MKMLRKSIVFLFLAFFMAKAQLLAIDPIQKEKENIADPTTLDNKRISVYLHPFILIAGSDLNALALYSTIEIPLSLYNAPIIRPSLLMHQDDIRVGSDFGWRHYLAGNGESLYLQPQIGFFYFSVKGWNESFDLYEDIDNECYDYMACYEHGKRSRGAWIDGMLYLGRSYKFAYVSISYDAGIGYACLRGGISECSITFDGNFGIGVSF